ncbi:class D beta-lactamase [Poseidonibacter sp.]|uniref:class D beta-lactamase n=1 Tax=Poseidonibacter sp. TaxID=2321188 RepID=UPI003C77AF5C
MQIIKIFIILNLLLNFVLANDKEIENIFQKKQIDGTLVLSSLNSDKEFIYNKNRALTQYIPASTFKVLNTLISLEEEVIKDEYETIKWDGKKRFYEPWNKDQNLQSAISFSCVWCYQKFAKELGNDKYLFYLKKLHYGNEKTGLDVTTFWLEGDVKISAYEQIDFLKKLYKNDLPFKQRNIDITKKILTVEETKNYIIKAKSGWSGKIGWYIGYIKTNSNVWFFALNADITKDQLKYRKQIVLEALKTKKIINVNN